LPQANDGEIDPTDAIRLENEQKLRDQMAFQRGGGVKLVDHPLYQAPQLKSSWMSMLPRFVHDHHDRRAIFFVT
jgi:hypothetical protein